MPAALPPSSGSGGPPKADTKIGPPQTAVIRAARNTRGRSGEGPIIDVDAVPVNTPTRASNGFLKTGIGIGALATGAAALWAAWSYSTSRPKEAAPIQAKAVPVAAADPAKPAAPAAPGAVEKKNEQTDAKDAAKQTAGAAAPAATPSPEEKVNAPEQNTSSQIAAERAAERMKLQEVSELEYVIDRGNIAIKSFGTLVSAYEPSKRMQIFRKLAEDVSFGDTWNGINANGETSAEAMAEVGKVLQNDPANRALGDKLLADSAALVSKIEAAQIPSSGERELDPKKFPGDRIQVLLEYDRVADAEKIFKAHQPRLQTAHKELEDILKRLRDGVTILKGRLQNLAQ